MPKKKTDLQKASGKLISAIQKEWGEELGGSSAEFSEDVMSAAHALLQAASAEEMAVVLGPKSVRQYLGDVWVQRHSCVKPAIENLESLLKKQTKFD
jgi:hypothetical protein